MMMVEWEMMRLGLVSREAIMLACIEALVY